MIERRFDHYGMGGSRNDDQFRTLRQMLQRRIDQVEIQIRILVAADHQRRRLNRIQIDQLLGGVDTEVATPAVGAVIAVIVPAAGAIQLYDETILNLV